MFINNIYFFYRSPRSPKSLAVPVDHSPLWTALTQANTVSTTFGDT